MAAMYLMENLAVYTNDEMDDISVRMGSKNIYMISVNIRSMYKNFDSLLRTFYANYALSHIGNIVMGQCLQKNIDFSHYWQ